MPRIAAGLSKAETQRTQRSTEGTEKDTGHRVAGLCRWKRDGDDKHHVLEGLTREILASAFEVHRVLGPGLLESTYRACLLREMADKGLQVREEVPITISYRGRELEAGYRADLIVDDSVLLELKAVERLLPVHEAQTLTYLKHAKLRVGLLLNFNVTRLTLGIRRFIR